MPEIKRTFTAGKMNKDLDERLVRNGEYRDALNIQVRTTDGEGTGIGDAGTVQNIKGNNDFKPEIYKTIGYNQSVDKADENNTNITRILGSVADEKNDKAYFFAAAPWPVNSTTSPPLDVPIPDFKYLSWETIQQNQIPVSEYPSDETLEAMGIEPDDYDPHNIYQHAVIQGKTPKIWVDSIIEVDAKIEQSNPIFIDKYAVTGRMIDIGSSNFGVGVDTDFTQITVADGSLYRVGMIAYLRDNSGNHLLFANGIDSSDGVGVEVVDIQGNLLTLATQQSAVNLIDYAFEGGGWKLTWVFAAERVLEFDYWTIVSKGKVKLNLIPNINIIDDLLFWTDGTNEPKKINITRSKKGTSISGWNSNPRHTKLYVSDPSDQTATYPDDLVDVRELEPALLVEGGDVLKENITVIREAPKSPPSLFMRNTDRTSEINFIVQHAFTDQNLIPPIPGVGTIRWIYDDVFDGIDIRLNDTLVFINTAYDQNPITIQAQVVDIAASSIEVRIISLDIDYDLLTLEQDLWSVTIEQEKPLFETKFGRVGYRYKYEDGEYSTYSPWSELAFLPGAFSYTPSQGFNNGMVNNLRYLVIRDFIPDTSVRPHDVQSIDVLWKTTNDQNVYVIKTITREIDSEWEDFTDDITDDELANTGSLIITSEMIHKVLPANQLFRGYDNVPKTALTQEITASRLVYGNYTQGYDIKRVVGLKQRILSDVVNFPHPEKSVKTLRSYKFGIVLGDEHGRETPVIASGYQVLEGETITGDISIPKRLSAFSNKFNLQQQWGSNGNSSPLNWIDYVKYYVKETSNEYYNLVLDRWYDAGDGNIWLAFPSVDRNKIDDQTYLILKNEHGNQNAVIEKARYKVLAIESEAPDFIKIDRRPLGRVEIDRIGIYKVKQNSPEDSGYSDDDVQDGVPDGLIGTTKILTDDGIWESWDNSFMDFRFTDFKGTAKMRIVGTFVPSGGDVNSPVEAFSPWRTVSRLVSAGSNRRGCHIRETFEAEDVDMYQKITAILNNPSEITVANVDNAGEGFEGDGDRIKYWMEFQDEVVENKPQFDGRFFVKIQKDEVLSQRVLGISVAGGDYQVASTYKIGYIANWDSNPAQDSPFYGGGEHAQFPWPNIANGEDVAGFNEANIDSWPNGMPNFGIGSPELTEDFWNWWGEQRDEGNAPSIFIDRVPCWGSYVFFQQLDYLDLPPEAPGGNGIMYSGVLQHFGSGYEPLNNEGPAGNWQPAGLAVGGVDYDNYPMERGQLTFSSLSANGAGFQAGEDSIFKAQMQEPGTLFRFQADPDQVVYRVLEIDEEGQQWGTYTYQYIVYRFNSYFQDSEVVVGPNPVEDSGYTPGQIITINTAQEYIDANVDGAYDMDYEQYQSFPVYYEVTADYPLENIEGPISVSGAENFPLEEGETSNPLQKRHSIITRFGRVNENGGTDEDRGVDISRWDPRGEVKHTGIGGLVIEILDEVGLGDLVSDSVATDSSCWETEPKEDLGVDIYYEASRGIPMYLTRNNINEYVDPSWQRNNACLFHVDKRTLESGATHQVHFPQIPWVSKTLGDDCVYVTKDQGGYFTPLVTEVINITNAIGVSIGDVVGFSHIGYHSSANGRYGLVTKSKVLDHMKPIVYGNEIDNIVDVPVPSDRYGPIIGVSLNTQSIVNPYQITFSLADWNAAGGDLITIGMEIISNNTDVGSFVTGFVYPDAQSITVLLNKPVLVKGTARFTFIDVTGWFRLERDTWKFDVDLGWFNCYSFGNGVESDRIRDDFNAPTIDNGIRVSSTFLEYKEEHLGSNLIHSSEIFNSTSGVNGLNQFNMAEKITKSLNPIYGSIQRLKTRDTDLVTFCEDKVLKVLASKDALFNADGNPQLTATNRVLGTAVPFVGDYGISKNPESMATDTYRIYFTDKQRGAVLRLSRDGLTPISNVGMKTYFREFLPKCDNIIGTYDVVNGEYNVTLSINEVDQGELVCACTTCCGCGCNQAASPETVTFNEGGKAWVSFKSFVHACGISVTGKYFTAPLPYHRGDQTADAEGDKDPDYNNQKYSPLTKIWMHHDETVSRNAFYGNETFNSEIEVTFNEMPDMVKSFRAINYEGSQANVQQFVETTGYDVEGNTMTNMNDGNYYNLTGRSGWKVQSFDTDLQTGFVPEFIQKENKWFNFIHGGVATVNNLDTTAITGNAAALNIQGIGFFLEDPADTQTDASVELTGNNAQFEDS